MIPIDTKLNRMQGKMTQYLPGCISHGAELSFLRTKILTIAS